VVWWEDDRKGEEVGVVWLEKERKGDDDRGVWWEGTVRVEEKGE
jgi:hypothetical protein